ncbi:ubiquitin thioesterase ZRANB1-like [Ylistrum balloti]|uniref:ubiquitin thioesterase ZRANB1-like n=1 Tax=Ylistrum balloti TaxID=509963 RepID=UPI002905A5AE|nr:ubiquitin thioesterase ZRANB1-like [Ylistrum balloti]
MTEKEKWACEYCTYENYPVTKRCTLCHAHRPPSFITDRHNEEQDIYKMAATMGQNKEGNNSNLLSGSSSSSHDPSNKWACTSCTFLNWPKTTKCSQCLTPKTRPSVSGSLSPTTERSPPITPTGVNAAESQRARKKTTQNKEFPSSPKAAKAIYTNDINNKTLATCYAKVKWTCKICTYENWPKSARCVMCGLQRGRSSPEITSMTTGLENNTSNLSGSTLKQSSVITKQTISPTSSLAAGTSGRELGARSPDIGTACSSAGLHVQEEKRETERKLKQIRNCMQEDDWLWLSACNGVVNGDSRPVETFVSSGGDPARQLTQEEVTLLNRPSAFEVGYTLVHLAIRFRREDMLAALLTSTETPSKAVKRLPSHLSADLASEIRREILAMLRQRKGEFPCQFLTDCVTFAIPTGVRDLPNTVQSQLFDEILDGDVQKELEDEYVVNWSVELTDRLGSRLYALWNRTAGDCLLDSILQSTWGIFDSDNTLRKAMSDSLSDAAMMFYPRWKEYEAMHAEMLHFTLDEAQWQNDWADILSIACTPGASLEQIHIFAIAHILRRPVIVYGVKYVKSFRGETIGLARFQGVYLPLLWERGFCWKSPVTLSYTRGHFSALVPMEMTTGDVIGAGADVETSEEEQVAYLPLVDVEGKLLPVHFLRTSEVGREEPLLREWLDVSVTKGGSLVALQKIGKRPLLVKRMLEDWIDHYRQMSHTVVPSGTPASLAGQNFSSDGESDQE